MMESNGSEADAPKNSQSSRYCSYAQNTIRYIAVTVSFSLCVWQASECMKRYLDEPTSFRITQEPVESFKFPQVVLCPTSTDYPFDLGGKFQEKCDQDETCKTLDSNERMNYPFDKLNTSFWGLWEELDTDPIIETGANCKYATNQSQCEEGDWLLPGKVDTVAGRCKQIFTYISFDFFGKYLSLWIRIIDNTDTISKEAEIGRYMMDLLPITPTLFTPRLYLESGATNEIEFTFVKYEYLNTSDRTCKPVETFDECQKDCVVSRFMDAKPNCTWPALVEADVPYCNTMSEVKEAGKLILDLTRGGTNKFCDCEAPCEMTDYEITHVIKKNRPVNTTEIIIFMPEGMEQVWKQFFLFPFSSLVSELGGSIGLFLGISLLSILTDFESLWCRLLKGRKTDPKHQIDQSRANL